ncbi:restriction endonuclease subunit S [Photobacterium sp. BZF1]|uniref:restriction endonuclease subunit S n=1 Tax=Photobacterium sp. BZF1 TaxID=1904457 RepID=UPI0016536835|nr:restriction endonuclease subunit S [Photobacterium sp. BZF1]MBC7004402.1 restriction endonuclease subunit S [Photobacterium sp. BZF1]
MGKQHEYSEYQSTGIAWCGKVPAHWSLVPCRAAVDHVVEKNHDGKVQNYLSVMANVGVIPYEEKGDIGNKKPDDLSKCKLVRKGQLVINSMNYSIGSYGMSDYDGVCSPVYIILQANTDTLHKRFALRVFENTPFQKHLATFGNGILAHRAAIGWDDIKGQYIPVPPMEEQEKILHFLDHETAKIDTLIEKQQQLIKLLKEKRQAVISHAVTKGLNPEAPMKDSGVAWLGEVPEHWKLTLFKYLVSQMGGGTPDKGNVSFWNGDIPWVSPKDMKVDYISTSQDFITDAAVKNSSTKLVPEQSILMVVRGMILIHSVPVALTTKPVTINQDMKALIPNKDIQPEFLLFFLKGIKDYILDFVETSAHGTKCLRTEDFENMQLFVPPIDEQVVILSSIKTSLDKLDSLIQKAEQAIILMSERRTALISAAVTGKIDVRNWQAPTSQDQALEQTA